MLRAEVPLRLVTERILLCALRSQDAAELASVARERAELLADASLRFGASLDEEFTYAAIAGFALPGPDTWAILDVVGSMGETVRVAIIHPEAEPADGARALVGRWTPSPADQIGLAAISHDRAARIITTGANELLLEAAAPHAEIRGTINQLGAGSLLIVPIIANDALLGAITYVRRDYVEPFSADDLALAEALAERCGLALQSARLFAAARAAHADAVEAQEDAVVARTIAEAALADAVAARKVAETARAEAQTANASKAQFLATMSHELRTPLNAIGGYAQLMEMGIHGPVTPEQAVDLVNIQRSQVHLLGLVDTVLSYAQLEAGRVVYNTADLILCELLPGLLALIAPQIQKKQLAYTCAECDPALRVRGDPEKVRQILVNLLGNATKFTPAGGSISVTCTEDPQMVYVHVTDNGVGISAKYLNSVFEPFMQVNRGFTTSSVGVGLGLAISRELARAMGGDLTVASEEGQGSVFSLSLPRV